MVQLSITHIIFSPEPKADDHTILDLACFDSHTVFIKVCDTPHKTESDARSLQNLSPGNSKSICIKGIFSDFNKIILWHKSTDIKKKRLFPKFQLILIFRLQVMHDYVH